MNETVTVDEAIKKGFRTVTFPSMMIMFAIFVPTIYFSIFSKTVLSLIAFISGFLFSWIYWNIAIVKWKLWAFENVRNVHELKRRAIEAKLIYPDNSFFEKTQIKTTSQKEKWNLLQEKFKQEDIVDNHFSVPNETLIYFSKKRLITGLILNAIVVVAGIYCIFKESVFGVGIIIFGGFFCLKKLMRIFNKQPQIILNDQGIQTASTPFYKWSQIQNEKALIEGFKYATPYLNYNFPNGKEHLNIDDLNISLKELNDLLITYRKRSQK